MAEEFDLSITDERKLVIHLLTSIDRKLDLTADKMSELSQSMAVITNEVKTSKENIEKLEVRVSDVEKRQNQTDRDVSSMMVRITGLATVISTVVGGFIAWLVRAMGGGSV